ncbi:Lar family restriction alleviation protein [Photorhabdus temperata]
MRVQPMGNKIELLPCPFCGSKDVGVFRQYEDDCPYRSSIVRCFNCDAQTAQFINDDIRSQNKMAIRAWNRRKNNDKQRTI